MAYKRVTQEERRLIHRWRQEGRGLREVAHGGDITGFNSFISRYPDVQFTVIVLSNIEMRPPGPVPDAGALAHKVAEIYLSDKLTKEKEHVSIILDPKILDSYTGQYKFFNEPKSWQETVGETFNIVRKNNQLVIQSRIGELELYAEGENNFFMKDNSTVRFARNDDNIITLTMDAMGLGVLIVEARKVQ